jgi:cobalt/nickel transport system permease protein
MMMHTSTFDRYETGESLIHRLDPRVKVVVTVLFILSNVLLPDGAWLAFLLAWGMAMGVNILARLRWDYALKRSFIALPFALAAVTVIFNLPGQTIFTLNLGPWQLTATDVGLIRFASIVIRSWLSVHMAILLTATTQFPDMMHALRHLRVPQLLVAVISFMYRYLFLLADEVMRLLRAREARSARLPGGGGGGTVLWRAKVAGHMVGQLFLRSYERSDRVYNAMLARGYRGHFLTLNPHVMQATDWLYAAAAVLMLVSLQVMARL